MGYRNKTYVAFASEDIQSYYLMGAWRANQHIEFDFFDAHALNVALDTSQPDTIRRRLGERLANTKQAIVLLSPDAKRKSGLSRSFFYYKVEAIARLRLPVIFANLNQSRSTQYGLIPTRLAAPYYSVSTSFQPKIVRHALDGYVAAFESNTGPSPKTGPHIYNAGVYASLGL